MPALRVDLETSAGSKIGSGPLIRCTNVRLVRRLSKAGTVSFDFPASDRKAANIASKQLARVWTRRNNAQVAVSVGVIDNIAARIQNDAPPLLTVSGDDLLSELANRRVLNLDISSSGSPIAIATALASIMAFAPAGWSIDTSTYTSSSATVYHKFGNETVLAALVWVANALGEQFRLKSDGSRTVEWLYHQQPVSGLRAVARGDAVRLASNTGVVLLDSLDEVTDTHATITRIYPYGAGNAKGRVTLANCTWTAPAGYTKAFDTVGGINLYYIKQDAADAANRIDDIQTYNSLAEIDSTSGTHRASASDQLAVTAYEDLRRRVAAVKTYRATVTKIDASINPGDTIRVVYRRTVDAYVAVNINADLVVMEVSTSFDASGIATATLTLATVDLLPRQTGNAVQSLSSGASAGSGVTQVAERALTSDVAVAASSVAATSASTVTITDAGTTTTPDVANYIHRSSGTPTAGFGSVLHFQADNSSNSVVNQAALLAEFVAATAGSTKSRLRLIAYDTSSREVMRIEASGTAAMIGFLGAAAAVRQTGGAATAGGAYTATEQGMLQKAYDALRTFGLLT